MSVYDEDFYNDQRDGSFKSAEIIVPMVREFIKPKLVMDIGCGLGTWLAVWKKYGAEVLGVDGDYVNREMLYIDKEEFVSANLAENYVEVGDKFDLVESLEVAEHLPDSRAREFVKNLTEISDVVLFSAAIPFQGGTNHINEQWQSYWADIFAEFDYIPVDCIRTQSARLNDVTLCYAQNILIYVRETSLSRHPLLLDFYLKHRECQRLDYVHPLTYELKVKGIDKIIELGDESIGKAVEAGIANGIEQARVKVAGKMLDRHMSLEEVANLTEMPPEKVREIMELRGRL